MSTVRALTTALVLAALFIAGSAQAQEDRIDPLGGTHRNQHSPQHFAFEFRLSPYSPDIDSDPALNGKTPYKDSFGTTPRVFIGAEMDWQALRIPHLGSLGPGVSAGCDQPGCARTVRHAAQRLHPVR